MCAPRGRGQRQRRLAVDRSVARGDSRIPALTSALPASTGRLDLHGRRAAIEVLADEQLERAEMSLGEVLEALPAGGDRLVRRAETLDDSQQVLGVLAELQLHHARKRRVARQLESRLAA